MYFHEKLTANHFLPHKNGAANHGTAVLPHKSEGNQSSQNNLPA